MCYEEEIEVIDLDEDEEDVEEKIYTSDGINIETGEYNPDYDAFYPDFKALADAERELYGERSF